MSEGTEARPTVSSLDTHVGRVHFTSPDDEGIVWIHTATSNLGGWNVARFDDGKYGAEWRRQWAAACLKPPKGE